MPRYSGVGRKGRLSFPQDTPGPIAEASKSGLPGISVGNILQRTLNVTHQETEVVWETSKCHSDNEKNTTAEDFEMCKDVENLLGDVSYKTEYGVYF